MDLRLYLRVIWRFRYLVLGGFLVALVLAFLAMVRVSPSGISYRQQKTYRATEILQLTTKHSVIDASQQSNLAQLAVGYVQVANGDVVFSRVRRSGPLRGAYQVVQLPGPNNLLLPVLSVSGTAHTPKQAATIAERVSGALAWWLDRSQKQLNVAPDKHVRFSIISRPKPVLFEGRKLTVPIIIFLSVLIATFGVVFILENLRPRPFEESLGEIEPLPVRPYDDRSFESDENGAGLGEGIPVASPSVHRGPE
jgi:hypothetical protein